MAAGVAALGEQGQTGSPTPVPPAAPLPDPASLIKIVSENQKQIEVARKNYIALRTDQEIDSGDHPKPGAIKVYEIHFIGPWEIDRLVSKDRKPLDEDERKKQDKEVAKQETKARERIAKQEAGEDPGKNAITPAKFLEADRFYNLRREMYQGHEVYAMDFAPRPDFHAQSLVDRLLKALDGTIWVDEQAKQIVRLEARFHSGVKVGGGLVGALHKGGNVVLEQSFVNGEVWMPSYAAIHLDARVLFFHKSIDGIFIYSDYRKFQVNSKILGSSPVPPPDANPQ